MKTLSLVSTGIVTSVGYEPVALPSACYTPDAQCLLHIKKAVVGTQAENARDSAMRAQGRDPRRGHLGRAWMRLAGF